MRKYSIEYVNNAFAADGYILLSKDYKNTDLKLKYICPRGHRHQISFGKWLEARRCPYCDGQGKPLIDHIKSEF